MDEDVFFGTIIIMIIIAAVASFGALTFYDVRLSTGFGEQSGVISEVEESGIIWNPPQIKLISIVPTYSSKDTVWYFGADEELTDLAKMYMNNQTPVVISYEIKRCVPRWEYDNAVIITDIKPME